MPRTVIKGTQIEQGKIQPGHLSGDLRKRIILSGAELPANPSDPCLFLLTEGDAGLYLYTSAKGWRKIGLLGDVSSINGIQFRYQDSLEWTNDSTTWRPVRSGGGGIRYILASPGNAQLEAWGTIVTSVTKVDISDYRTEHKRTYTVFKPKQ